MELLSLSLVSCPPVHSKGEVSLNGKKIKAYSGLRPELQHLARLAKEKIAVKGSCQDPLTIAQELTQELIDAPVTMVIEGEDDARVRISSFHVRQCCRGSKTPEVCRRFLGPSS